MSSGQQGNETRTSIIPTGFSRPISYPNYNFADALKTPADLGVQVGDSFGDVLNAAKGIIYYTDMIGFGQSSNSLDADLNPQPLGINYFVDSGKTCSNGANMWQYMSNIPDGDALGGGVQRAMSQLGLPGLKGLAPGMVEDLENDKYCIVEPNIVYHQKFSLVNSEEALAKSDVIVFLTAHDEFKDLVINENQIVLDFCGVINNMAVQFLEIVN
jgi:hypothetical protein